MCIYAVRCVFALGLAHTHTHFAMSILCVISCHQLVGFIINAISNVNYSQFIASSAEIKTTISLASHC